MGISSSVCVIVCVCAGLLSDVSPGELLLYLSLRLFFLLVPTVPQGDSLLFLVPHWKSCSFHDPAASSLRAAPCGSRLQCVFLCVGELCTQQLRDESRAERTCMWASGRRLQSAEDLLAGLLPLCTPQRLVFGLSAKSWTPCARDEANRRPLMERWTRES